MTILVTRPFGIGNAAGGGSGGGASLCWSITSLQGSPAVPSSGSAALTPDTFDVEWKPDGTKLFALDYNNSRIYAWDVGTPWEISTAAYNGEVLTGIPGATSGFVLHPDGDRAYLMLGEQTSFDYQIQERTLTTPWDITTLQAFGGSPGPYLLKDELGANTGGWFITDTRTIYITPDGTKLFHTFRGNPLGTYRVHVASHTMSIPWDTSTLSYDSLRIDIQSFGQTNSRGLEFCNSGEKMFTGYASTSGISSVRQFRMPTPFDLSGGLVAETLWQDAEAQQSNVQGISFDKENGDKIYISGDSPAGTFQYDIPDPTLGL